MKTVHVGSSFEKSDKAQREGYFVGFRQATSEKGVYGDGEAEDTEKRIIHGMSSREQGEAGRCRT